MILTTEEVITTSYIRNYKSDLDHWRSDHSTLGILTTEEVITIILTVISAITNVILATEETITATLNI